MDLRLRLETPDRDLLDLVVAVDGQTRVADLTTALARHCGTAAAGLYCRRLGARLGPEQTVAEAQLRQGEQLVLLAPGGPLPPPVPATPVALLLVTGGPCSGVRVPLTEGRHRVGRSALCEVVLSDPAISRIHLELSVSPGGVVTVSDAKTANGTFLDGVRLESPEVLAPGREIEIGRSLLCFVAAGADAQPLPDADGNIAFNRPPRAAPRGSQLTFSLPPSPRRARPAGLSVSSAVLPLVLGLALYFASNRQPLMLLITLLSPLMVVGSFVESWIGTRRQNRLQHARYERLVQELEANVAQTGREETARRRAGSPGLGLLVERARGLQPSLWERRPDHPDFLLLRIGWGDQPSGITVDSTDEGSEAADEVRARIAAMLERSATLRTVPLAVSLREVGSLGLTGDRDQVMALARSLVAQLAGLHSPEEVALVAAIAATARDQWRWLAYLPHVHPEAPAVPGVPVTDNPAGARDLLERLGRLMDQRLQRSASSYDAMEAGSDPSVVAVLDGAGELPRSLVDGLLSGGPGCGLHVIWIGRSRTTLPGRCGAFIELDQETGAPVLTVASSGDTRRGLGADLAPLAVAEELALSLAPVRDVEAPGRQADVPRHVGLLELLDLEDQPVDRIIRRWQHDDGRLAARLGLTAGGRPCEISLRSDGPHALAGGMTGAGKSELLQSMVASLAAAHGPSRLTFILIDYKGGAAFKDCIHLPHTVGFVTDLDGHLVNRALTSLRAELRRRELALRETGSLVEMEARDPERAFPSLVIIVDEFAALASELPEFVDGMVDIAQRGRSLGIHLMLATQRPAGVISDAIRTNTQLRLSLRFSDASDSQDVIGTDAAARPGLPQGRAFLRTGRDAVIEFQAAYASGRTCQDGRPPATIVYDMDISGQPAERQEGGRAGGGPAAAPTDLMRVVQAARDAAARLRLQPPAPPWLPALPGVLPLRHLIPGPPDGNGSRVVALGLLDDPQRQRQAPLTFHPAEDGSLLIYGAGGSGKTTLLRTLAVALAQQLPPDHLNLYALDFASRGLRPLDALPHCGGVIAADEPERALRLLRMLQAELERRKTLLAARGATTLDEYAGAGGRVLPWVVVLLDGYAAFSSAFEDVDLGAPLDQLRALVGEGRPQGITFAITAARAGAVPTALAAAVGRRLILRMANDDEYMYVGLDRSLYQGARLPPGRGFTDQGSLEFQCAIAGDEPAGGAQAAMVERIGAELRSRHPEASVPAVRLLPTELPAAQLPAPGRSLEAVIGLLDGDLSPARVDLAEGQLLVVGPRRSGRSTAIAACAVSLARAPGGLPLYLLAPRRSSRLARLRLRAEAAVGGTACEDLAQRLAAALRSPAGDDVDLSQGGVVLLDDGEELLDSAAAPALETIARLGRDRNVRLVAGVETQAAHRAFGGWLAEIRRDRQTLLLDPDPVLDGTLAGGVRLPTRSAALPPGRGYLVLSGLVAVVQVALPADGASGS